MRILAALRAEGGEEAGGRAAGRSITFDWGDVAGAASYTIQIDDSESFSAPQTVNQTHVFSQLTTSTLPTRRVRANDGSGGAGACSAARRFEVKH